MKAQLRDTLPAGPEWLYEVKLDGIRAIAIKDAGRVQLYSRLPRELTAVYPHLVSALRGLPAKRFVLDGEIVSLDEQGHSSFQALQNRLRDPVESASRAILYYAFDLLHLNGRDLKNHPLLERKKALARLLDRAGDPIRLSPALEASAGRVWSEVLRLGLEGVIAKQRDSAYEPGRRSGRWVKVKAHMEQEFVIGGYTAPEGTRQHFGALIVGYYAGRDLIFASRVGTGFDFATLRSLHRRFQPLRTDRCPFANLPTQRGRRFGQGMTAADMKRCFWIKPRLVAQVRFMEWTRDANLRQPVFVGLREDKKPADVVREVRRARPAHRKRRAA
jgi:bifunctional non-homologous end joining protein LigD